jgi:hypothetical protein
MRYRVRVLVFNATFNNISVIIQVHLYVLVHRKILAYEPRGSSFPMDLKNHRLI